MSQHQQGTNFEEILHDLDGGVFAQRIGAALSEVAAGVAYTGRKGQVTISFDLKKLTDIQVQIDHKIKFVAPTQRGKRTDEATTATPMHVGARGRLTLFPESQPSLLPETKDARSDA